MYVFSKVAHYINIFEKIIWDTGNFSVKSQTVNILGFVSRLKISHLFCFVLAIVVAFVGGGVRSFKNVKTVFNLRAIQKEVIG